MHVNLAQALLPAPLILSPTITVMAAIQAMSDRDAAEETTPSPRSACGSCAVVDDTGRLLGLFTERDVVRLTAQQAPLDRPLSEVITPSEFRLRGASSMELKTLIDQLEQYPQPPWPLVDGADRLLGLITPSSLLRVIQAATPNPQSELRPALATRRDGHWFGLILATSARRCAEQTLTRQRDLNRLMVEITSRFIEVDATTFAVEIERSLALMGEFIQADSSYRVVFDEPARLMHVTEAWYHPDRPSQTPPPEGLPLEAFPWAIATLRQRQPVCVPQVDALPDEQGRDRASWQQLNIQAVLSVPLVQQGTVVGFLGFLSFSQPMVWEDDLIQLLTVFAQTIASTQERLHAEQARRLSEAQNRAILTTLPDLIVCVGADGRYRELYNPGHSLDLCPPGLDRVGKHLTEVLPAGIAARQLQVLTQVLATGEAQVYEQVIWVGDRWQYEEVRAMKSHPEEVLFLIRDISDRKDAEQQLQDLNQRLEGKVAARTAALQASEAQMRALVAAIPDLLLRVRWAGQHLEYTQPWVQAHQTQAQLLRPGEGGVERLEEKRRAVEQAMTSGELQVYEQQLNLGDRHRYEEVRVVGIDAQEALMIVRDITDRKQAEQENQRLRDRLEYLLNESPALIYSCRVSGDYGATYMSENVRTILGYEPAQFTTESSFWADHLHPEDAPRVFANLAALWERGYHCQEYRFLHRDGHYLWLRDEVRLLRDEHGNPLEIVGSRVDIDDRKRAEQALQESETRFRRVFDSNVVGMIFTDFSGQISDANDYFLEMLGYERADLATGRLNWATLTPPEYRAQDEQVIAHLRQQGSIAPWDKVYIHQDGHWVWVLVGVAMLAQDEGTCVYVVVDISDRQQAEAQLQRTNAELSRATRLKDEFLANMSHELRTPLNAILGLTEGLQEEIFGPLHDPQRLALSTIERSGSHLLALINDILDVAKIESGHLQLNLAPTAIAPLCQSSLAFVKQQAQNQARTA